MRYRLLCAALFFAGTFCYPPHSTADEPSDQPESDEQITGERIPNPVVATPELIEAYHVYQRAQLRWQQYRFVELPRQRQLLDGQVRLLEGEVLVLSRRVRDYRPFLQVGQYSPVRIAAENDFLALQATEQALRQLNTEQIQLQRYGRQNAQLHQLEVLRAAARVKQILAEGSQTDASKPMTETLTSLTSK